MLSGLDVFDLIAVYRPTACTTKRIISQRAALVKHGFALPLPAELYGGGPTKRHLADVYRKVQQRQFRVASVTDSPAVRPGAGYQFYGFRFT